MSNKAKTGLILNTLTESCVNILNQYKNSTRVLGFLIVYAYTVQGVPEILYALFQWKTPK